MNLHYEINIDSECEHGEHGEKKKKKKKKKKGAFSADSQPNISGARADRLRVLPNTIIFFDIMLLNLAICKF